MKLPNIPATAWRRIHGGLAITWTLLIVPTILWLHDSVLWIGLMSAWANAAAHFSAYQGARAEDTNGTST